MQTITGGVIKDFCIIRTPLVSIFISFYGVTRDITQLKINLNSYFIETYGKIRVI
jgi:hypothetical protein